MDAETGVGEDTAGAASDISGISVGPRLFAGVFIVYATLAVLLLAMLVAAFAECRRDVAISAVPIRSPASPSSATVSMPACRPAG